MARIRSIHPGLFTDEAFVSVSLAARLLLPGLWTEADDHGVFEWKPLGLKMKIFPADNLDVAALLVELEGADIIKRFSTEGREYGLVRNFCKYQRPKKPVYAFHLPDKLKEFAGFEEDNQEYLLRKTKCEEQRSRCYYCRTEISYYRKRADSLELDHVVPRIAGGTDDPNNLVATCRSCNRKKGAMSAPEFSEWLAKNSNRTANRREDFPKSEHSPQMEDGEKKEKDGADAPIVLDPSEAERELFRRGKTVLGKNAGGQISNLLKAKGGNVALARSAIEMAATKEKPAEYVARIIRGPPLRAVALDERGNPYPEGII